MKKLLPFSKWYHNLLVATPAFLAGAYFDLTPYRLSPGSALAGSGLFLTLARVLGGAILALLVLALLRSGRDLLGLGKVGWRQMAVLFLALNALTALYVCTSRTVYVWDNAGYWSVARSLSQQWLGRSQILEVLKSTVHMDYNYLLAFPISLVMRVFGGSRAVFLFAISNLYTLPGLWALAAMAQKRRFGGVIMAALFPMLTYLGLVGYVDVAACSLALWAYVVYTSDRPPVSRGVFTGALLVGTFLLRRYFLFFALSFGLAALVKKLLFERKDWRDFGALFGSCALCAVYLTPNFLLEKALGTNYGDLYSAYALGLRTDFFILFRYFGWALLLALILGGTWAICRGKDRPNPVFALCQMAVCFVAFVAVQTHGQQHLLLYLPALALLAANLLDQWSDALPDRRRLLPILPAAVIFVNCLIPKAQPASIQAIRFPDPVPSFVFYGPTRSDTGELIRLSDYLNSLSAGEQKSAAVLCSSLLFNSETLTNLRPSLGLPEPATSTVIRYQGSVDKRDPFNWNTATADYLLVGEPMQVHLGEENQQVICLLAHDILDGTGPGTAYSPLPEAFTLQDGSVIRVYQRTRNWTREDFFSLSDRLSALYPDYAELYAVPDWVR